MVGTKDLLALGIIGYLAYIITSGKGQEAVKSTVQEAGAGIVEGISGSLQAIGLPAPVYDPEATTRENVISQVGEFSWIGEQVLSFPEFISDIKLPLISDIDSLQEILSPPTDIAATSLFQEAQASMLGMEDY